MKMSKIRILRQEELDKGAETIKKIENENTKKSLSKSGERYIEKMCKKLGYGWVIYYASKVWQHFDYDKSLQIGPQSMHTSQCLCITHPEKLNPDCCEYCMGTGWLTDGVHKLVSKKILRDKNSEYVFFDDEMMELIDVKIFKGKKYIDDDRFAEYSNAIPKYIREFKGKQKKHIVGDMSMDIYTTNEMFTEDINGMLLCRYAVWLDDGKEEGLMYVFIRDGNRLKVLPPKRYLNAKEMYQESKDDIVKYILECK